MLTLDLLTRADSGFTQRLTLVGRIHLSWAGFITSEGSVVDLGDGDVTMLRYRFSERALSLADVFGQPSSAPDPHIKLATGRHWPPLPSRATINSDLIGRLLGRPPAT